MHLYGFYDVTFCVCSLYFVYGEKKTIQRNKEIKQSLDWLKRFFNALLKNTFYLIKLKFSEAFREK